MSMTEPLGTPSEQELAKSLERGCQWIISMMDERGSIQSSDQAALYYKVPASLAINGAFGSAFSCLNWIASRFLGERGQLEIPPEQEASRWTNTYDRGWLVWGAEMCGRYDLAFPLAQDILTYQNPRTGGFRDTKAALNSGGGVEHAMTAGFAGLGLLATGHLAAARRTADFLIDLLEIQPDPGSGIYLALDYKSDGTRQLLLQQTSRDYVDRSGSKQRPARLGPVQVLLVRLYRLTKEEKYLETARRYTDVILTGAEGIYSCVEAHKYLWGLTELYEVAPDEPCRVAARQIACYILQRQQPDGQWWGDAVGGESNDQSLELRLNTTCNALVGLAYYRYWRGR